MIGNLRNTYLLKNIIKIDTDGTTVTLSFANGSTRKIPHMIHPEIFVGAVQSKIAFIQRKSAFDT